MSQHLPHLSRFVEGVEFSLPQGGRLIRVVATRELLENVFGAVRSPEGWMDGYRLNRAAIHSAADMLYKSQRSESWRESFVLSEKLWSELSPSRHATSMA